MGSSLDALLKDLTAIQWVAFVGIGLLAINGLANLLESLRKIHNFFRDVFAHFRGRAWSDAELQRRARTLSWDLMTFLQQRNEVEPPFSFDRFSESTAALTKHSAETQNLYARDFAGSVGKVREELLKRNIRDRELDSYWDRPTNEIGIRTVAARVAALAERVGLRDQPTSEDR